MAIRTREMTRGVAVGDAWARATIVCYRVLSQLSRHLHAYVSAHARRSPAGHTTHATQQAHTAHARAYECRQRSRAQAVRSNTIGFGERVAGPLAWKANLSAVYIDAAVCGLGRPSSLFLPPFSRVSVAYRAAARARLLASLPLDCPLDSENRSASSAMSH